jgi:Co/Zn/Cd efflux system component
MISFKCMMAFAGDVFGALRLLLAAMAISCIKEKSNKHTYIYGLHRLSKVMTHKQDKLR